MRVSVSSAFLKGVVKAPPSKSLAHRALICAALARGKKTIIDNIELSNDVRATLSCLCSIGVKYNYNEYKLTVYSPEKYNEKAELFCMESGSTLRFLMPVMSALGIECKIDGSGNSVTIDEAEYNACLVNRGKEVCILDPLGEYRAVAEGIDESGSLLVTLPDGTRREIISGEVSVRGIYGYV